MRGAHNEDGALVYASLSCLWCLSCGPPGSTNDVAETHDDVYVAIRQKQLKTDVRREDTFGNVFMVSCSTLPQALRRMPLELHHGRDETRAQKLQPLPRLVCRGPTEDPLQDGAFQKVSHEGSDGHLPSILTKGILVLNPPARKADAHCREVRQVHQRRRLP